jgi:hypothetical protein
MSKIIELAKVIDQEIENNRCLAESAFRELQDEKKKNKEFKRRLIQLLDEFYPDYS